MAEAKQSQYEAMFLLGNAAADLEAGINLCRGVIERHQGQIILIKKWDERKLMYEINGQKRGTYIIAFFTAPGGAISAIERDVKLSEDILRVMVLKADHLNKEEMEAVEPQPVAPREERPSWERPSFDDRGPRRDDRAPREGEDRGPRAPRGPRREEEAAGTAAKE